MERFLRWKPPTARRPTIIVLLGIACDHAAGTAFGLISQLRNPVFLCVLRDRSAGSGSAGTAGGAEICDSRSGITDRRGDWSLPMAEQWGYQTHGSQVAYLNKAVELALWERYRCLRGQRAPATNDISIVRRRNSPATSWRGLWLLKSWELIAIFCYSANFFYSYTK